CPPPASTPRLGPQPGQQQEQEQQADGNYPPAGGGRPPADWCWLAGTDQLLLQAFHQPCLRACMISICCSWATAGRLVSSGCRPQRRWLAIFCQACWRATNWAAQASRRVPLVVFRVMRWSPWTNSRAGLLG